MTKVARENSTHLARLPPPWPFDVCLHAERGLVEMGNFQFAVKIV